MLDYFMSRTLHHFMGPLHSLQLTCDLVIERQSQRPMAPEDEENIKLLTIAGEEITSTVNMLRDVSDLARFDQGAIMKTTLGIVTLKSIGVDALAAAPQPSSGDVDVLLNLEGGGPESIFTDRSVLLRVLGHLLDNAIRETKEGCVTLRIGYHSDNVACGKVTFQVEDTGPGLPSASKGAGVAQSIYGKDGG